MICSPILSPFIFDRQDNLLLFSLTIPGGLFRFLPFFFQAFLFCQQEGGLFDDGELAAGVFRTGSVQRPFSAEAGRDIGSGKEGRAHA